MEEFFIENAFQAFHVELSHFSEMKKPHDQINTPRTWLFLLHFSVQMSSKFSRGYSVGIKPFNNSLQ
jgi:hypothetical protein